MFALPANFEVSCGFDFEVWPVVLVNFDYLLQRLSLCGLNFYKEATKSLPVHWFWNLMWLQPSQTGAGGTVDGIANHHVPWRWHENKTGYPVLFSGVLQFIQKVDQILNNREGCQRVDAQALTRRKLIQIRRRARLHNISLLNNCLLCPPCLLFSAGAWLPFFLALGLITPESCPSQINPPAPQHCPKRAVLRTGIHQVRSPRTLKMTCENEQPSPEKRLPIAPYSVSIGQILSLFLATSSKPYVA